MSRHRENLLCNTVLVALKRHPLCHGSKASEHALASAQDGAKVDVVEGAEPVQLSEKVRKLLGQPPSAEPPSALNGKSQPTEGAPPAGGSAQPEAAAPAASPFTAQAAKGLGGGGGGGGGDLTARMERLTRSSPVVLFMKVLLTPPTLMQRCDMAAKAMYDGHVELARHQGTLAEAYQQMPAMLPAFTS